MWRFLAPMKKSGAPLPRSLLAQRCLKDLSLLSFILEAAMQRSRLEPKSSQTYIAFAAATVLDVLEKVSGSVQEPMLRVLLPFILHGLKRFRNRDYLAAAYMITARLCNLCQFDEELIQTLLTAISRGSMTDLKSAAFVCFATVCNTQSPDSLGEGVMENMLRKEGQAEDFCLFVRRFRMTVLLKLYLRSFIAHGLDTAEGETHLQHAHEIVLRLPGTYRPIVQGLASQVLHGTYALSLLSLDKETISARTFAALRILRVLSNRFPNEVNAAIEDEITSVSRTVSLSCRVVIKIFFCSTISLQSKDEKPFRSWLLAFLSKSFSRTRHEVMRHGDVTLGVGIRHSNAQVRLQALKRVSELLGVGPEDDQVMQDAHEDAGTKESSDFFLDAVFSLVGDEERRISLHALSVLESLLEPSSPHAPSLIAKRDALGALVRLVQVRAFSDKHLAALRALLAAAKHTNEISAPDGRGLVLSHVLPAQHCISYAEAVLGAGALGLVGKVDSDAILQQLKQVRKLRKSWKKEDDDKAKADMQRKLLKINLTLVEGLSTALANYTSAELHATTNEAKLYGPPALFSLILALARCTAPHLAHVCALLDASEALLSASASGTARVSEVVSEAAVLEEFIMASEQSQDLEYVYASAAVFAVRAAAATLLGLYGKRSKADTPHSTDMSDSISIFSCLRKLVRLCFTANPFKPLQSTVRALGKGIHEVHFVQLLEMVCLFPPIPTVADSAAPDNQVIPVKVSPVSSSVNSRILAFSELSEFVSKKKATPLLERNYHACGLAMMCDPSKIVRLEIAKALDQVVTSRSSESHQVVQKMARALPSEGKHKRPAKLPMLVRGKEERDVVLISISHYLDSEEGLLDVHIYAILVLLISLRRSPPCIAGTRMFLLAAKMALARLSDPSSATQRYLMARIVAEFTNLSSAFATQALASSDNGAAQIAEECVSILLEWMTLPLHLRFDLITAPYGDEIHASSLLVLSGAALKFELPLASIAIGALSKGLFSRLPVPRQWEMVHILAVVGKEKGTPAACESAAALTAGLPVSAAVILHGLLRESVVSSSALLPKTPSKSSKRRKAVSSAAAVEVSEEDQARDAAYICTALEYLEKYPALLENRDSCQNIAGAVFSILAQLSNEEHYLFSLPSRDYLVSLSSLLLRTLLEKARVRQEADGSDALSKKELSQLCSQINVEVIVEAMSRYGSPQLCNSMLLLLAEIARLDSTRVMSSVVPIFTYMGTSSVLRDDNYTFQIVHDVIAALVPVVIASRPAQLDFVIDLFVGAIEKIPRHRLLLLFAMLLKEIQVSNLYRVLLSLVMRSVRVADSQFPMFEFLFDICLQFSPLHISGAFVELMKVCVELPYPESDTASLMDLSAPEEDKSVVGLASECALSTDAMKRCSSLARELSIEEVHRVRSNVLRLVLDYYRSKPVLTKLISLAPKEEAFLQRQLLLLFQLCLVQLRRLHGSDNEAAFVQLYGEADESERDEGNELTLDLVEVVNDLMSINTFVLAITELLTYRDAGIRHRALILLNDKMSNAIQYHMINERHLKLLLSLVERLTGVVEKGLDGSASTEKMDVDEELDDEEVQDNLETAVNVQSALLGVEILARHFAAGHPAAFENTILYAMPCLFHRSLPVVCSAIVYLSTLCAELRARMIPYIPKFVPAILDLLEGAALEFASGSAGEDNHLLLMSTLSALEVMLVTVGEFLSPYFTRILAVLLQPAFSSGKKGHKVTVGKVNSVLNTFISKVAHRYVLSALFASYAQSAPLQTTIRLVTLLRSFIESLPAHDVMSAHKKIFKFFMDVFETRKYIMSSAKAAIGSKEIQQLAALESISSQCFSAFVVKLNEQSFKPVFLKLVHWATDSELGVVAQNNVPRSLEERCRMRFLLEATLQLSETLKSIFCPYYAYLLDIMVSYCNDSTIIQGQVDKNSAEDAMNHDLLVLMVKNFHRLFLFDGGDIVDASTFQKLVGPLVNILGSDSLRDEETHGETASYIVPCLVQLAVCVNSDLLWKTLNHNVLQKLRHKSASVRHAALDVQYGLYERLGEEFLLLLPESISHFSEAMEDSDPSVEERCRQLLKLIDSFLGEESIRDYF